MKQKQQFPKDHPYMKRLDEVLSHYFVLKTIDPALHGEDYEEMKEEIEEKSSCRNLKMYKYNYKFG